MQLKKIMTEKGILGMHKIILKECKGHCKECRVEYICRLVREINLKEFTEEDKKYTNKDSE